MAFMQGSHGGDKGDGFFKLFNFRNRGLKFGNGRNGLQ
jgi:hypothetical protein